MEDNKYKILRTQNPEFQDLTDAELQAYIDVYDEHLALGFTPHSYAMVVAGCFILFCNWLFFNAGSAFTIAKDKEFNSP